MTRTVRSLGLVGLLLACGAAPALHAQELLFRHYTTQNEINPLPAPAITDVYQDRQGYVWLAIYGTGLVRYDGQRMETFSDADGLHDLEVFALVEDAAGRLWVASATRSLAVSERPLADYAPGSRVRFTSEIGPVPLYQKPNPFPVNTLAADRSGNVWLGTLEDGIVRYRVGADGAVRADTLSTAPTPGAANTRVLAVTGRRDGSVWAGLRGGGLLVFDAESRTPRVVEAAQVPCRSVETLYEDASGVLWGGCSDGPVWRLADRGEALHFERVGEPMTGNITAIVEAGAGKIWVAGLDMGIVEVALDAPDRPVRYGRTSGLLDANVWALMRDREGNLWVAQNSGLSRLPANHAAFRFYTGTSHAGERPVLPAPDATSIVPHLTFGSAAGGAGPLLAVGTSAGVALIQPDGSAAHITSEQGLANDIVLSLCADGAHRLWMGTRAGFSVVSPEAALPPGGSAPRPVSIFGQRLYLKNYAAPSVNTCRAFALPRHAGADEQEEVVCLASNPGLHCLAGGAWLTFSEAAGLPGDLWTALPDEEGHVYVGAKAAGIYRTVRPLTLDLLRSWAASGSAEVTETAFAPLRDASGAAPLLGGVSALARAGHTLWANTDSGVVALEGSPPRLTRLDEVQEMGAGPTSLAYSPVTGTLWLGGREGLTEIDPATRTVVGRLTQEHGLLGNATWGPAAIVIGADGTVHHASSRGVTLYRSALAPPNRTAPLLAFTGIAFREGNRGNNELNLHYAALSFVNEKLVRYRTRLAEYDADWSPETSETSIRYTNLPAVFMPRRYTFEVLAANNDGVWTETPLRHTFFVQPPWWLRWWSFLIYGVLLAAGVFAVDRFQRRRLLRIEREKARERELEHAHEIERAYEKLKTTQAQLVQQEKLASLGALTAGIAHEIKNPLNFINNFAQLTGELVHELRDEAAANPDTRLADVEDVLSDLELNADRIAEHGRRADGIIRGMLAHARGSTGRREAIDLNALADEYATLAYHGARAQKPDVRVALEKDLDPQVGRVEVMPQEISRVLLNLLGNAFYAVGQQQAPQNRSAPENGQAGGYVPTVRIATRRQAGGVEIRVEDNGAGIPEAVQARIFEPFFTTKPTGEGTGLGLSLSHEIVAQGHGGTLTVESREGAGTTFRVFLPDPSPAVEVRS